MPSIHPTCGIAARLRPKYSLHIGVCGHFGLNVCCWMRGHIGTTKDCLVRMQSPEYIETWSAKGRERQRKWNRKLKHKGHKRMTTETTSNRCKCHDSRDGANGKNLVAMRIKPHKHERAHANKDNNKGQSVPTDELCGLALATRTHETKTNTKFMQKPLYLNAFPPPTEEWGAHLITGTNSPCTVECPPPAQLVVLAA